MARWLISNDCALLRANLDYTFLIQIFNIFHYTKKTVHVVQLPWGTQCRRQPIHLAYLKEKNEITYRGYFSSATGRMLRFGHV